MKKWSLKKPKLLLYQILSKMMRKVKNKLKIKFSRKKLLITIQNPRKIQMTTLQLKQKTFKILFIHLKVKNRLKNSHLASTEMNQILIKPCNLRNKKKERSQAKYLITFYWSHLFFQRVFNQKQISFQMQAMVN